MQLLDFHAHILPHMDHGSSRTATSHRQLELIHAREWLRCVRPRISTRKAPCPIHFCPKEQRVLHIF